MSILIFSVGGRERIVSNYTRTDSAPSSTGTLTDLRYERLETTLSLSLSLSLSLLQTTKNTILKTLPRMNSLTLLILC